MHHFVVKFLKKFRLRRQGGIDPLTKILRTPLLVNATISSGVTVSLGAPGQIWSVALPLHFHKKSHAHKLRSQYSIIKKNVFLKERAYPITQ